MRIISASRRTDIPAFYSKWFMNRINAGFCHWINPFNGQVVRVSLRPEDCLAIVFWTRSPGPMLPHLRSLGEKGYKFYFHYTINGYPSALESHSPPLDHAVATLRRLSDLVSPSLVFWRYDPIIISDRTPADYHVERFDCLSSQLAGYSDRCFFSFVDMYGKTERNLKRVEREQGLTFQTPTVREQRDIAQRLRAVAEPKGIELFSCCGPEVVGEGIGMAHCIDLELVRALRSDPTLRLKDAPTRVSCGCVEASDIGAYDTCSFGCTYCYATNSRKAALERMKAHDPDDTVLWRPSTIDRSIDLSQMERQSGRPRKLPVAPVQLPLLDP